MKKRIESLDALRGFDMLCLVALSDLLEAQTMLKKSRDELTDSRVEYRINLVTYRQLAKD